MQQSVEIIEKHNFIKKYLEKLTKTACNWEENASMKQSLRYCTEP